MKHEESLRLKENSLARRQEIVTQAISRRNRFTAELCEALVKPDNPIYKLWNVNFKNCLETWTSQGVASETTLSDSYVPTLYEETLDGIRNAIGDGKI